MKVHQRRITIIRRKTLDITRLCIDHQTLATDRDWLSGRDQDRDRHIWPGPGLNRDQVTGCGGKNLRPFFSWEKPQNGEKLIEPS